MPARRQMYSARQPLLAMVLVRVLRESKRMPKFCCQLGDVGFFDDVEVGPGDFHDVNDSGELFPSLDHIEFGAQIMARPEQSHATVIRAGNEIPRGQPIELLDVAKVCGQVPADSFERAIDRSPGAALDSDRAVLRFVGYVSQLLAQRKIVDV